MTARTTRPKCVLLDANIVIEAHSLGVWNGLLDQCKVVTPSTVVRDEALFFSRRLDGVHKDIHLPTLVDQGRVSELAATADELAILYNKFDAVFVSSVDVGEAEALALLLAGKAPGALFCTADAPAIRALAMLGLSEVGISMETLLERLGLSRPLPRSHYGEEFFREHIRRGSINLVTREGLADK